MSDIGITLGYEQDKCSICKKKKEIRYVYNLKKSRAAALCDECVADLGTITTEEVLERFGKKTTKKHVKLLTKAQLEKAGFELTGIKDKQK